MDNKRTTTLAFVAIAMMIAVAFVGFIAIGDAGTDAADEEYESGDFIVDGTHYSKLSDAVKAAHSSSSKTVKFNQDCTITYNVKTFDNVYLVSGLTIDLGGHTVSTHNGGFVLEGVGFTVCNGNIHSLNDASYVLWIGNGDNETSDVTVTGVTLVGGINVFCADDVKLEGLKFTGKDYYSVWCDEYGQVVIKDGTYKSPSEKGKAVFGVDANNGSLIIEGGVFDVEDGNVLALQGKKFNSPVVKGGFFYREGGKADETLKEELSKYVAEGYYVADATVDGKSGYKVLQYEASITDEGTTTYYNTLLDAIKAVKNGQTIELLRDVTDGAGIGIFTGGDKPQIAKPDASGSSYTKVDMAISKNEGFTIDFNGYEYCIKAPQVGSTGYESQAVHLEKDISVTLKNGKLSVVEGDKKTFNVIQNYCNLTLDNMVIDGTNLCHSAGPRYYVVSINYGTVVIEDTTIIGKSGSVAFDVCGFSTYGDHTVTVQGNTVITGDIELSNDKNDRKVSLTIENINMNGSFVMSTGGDTVTVSIANGTFSNLSGLQYLAETGTYGFNKDVEISSMKLKSGQKLSVLKDVTLTIPEDVVFTGTVIGPEDNTFVANGVKAGEGGITITGGSLIISGNIVQDPDTYSGVTVTVSGDSITIAGTLDEGATMVIDKDTSVTIAEKSEFASNGTITNNGTIVNEGKLINSSTSKITNTGSIENKSSIVNEETVESTGTVTNTGTLKMTGSSKVTGSVVNNGVVADERTSGDAVEIDSDNSTGVVVTKTNADAYKDTDTKVIVEDPETSGITEGTVTVESDTYAFVDGITTTGDYVIVMKNQQYGTYTLTIPEGTVIADATIITIKCDISRTTSNSMSYEITTPEIKEFSVKVPVQTGFKSAKVVCIDYPSTEITKIRYNSSSGYVSFNAEHNSTFTITLSEATPSSGTSDAIDENTAFVGAIVVLVVAILALAVVIKRK